MFCLNYNIHYHLCPGCTDMSKEINSLVGVVKEQMNVDVRKGDMFMLFYVCIFA